MGNLGFTPLSRRSVSERSGKHFRYSCALTNRHWLIIFFAMTALFPAVYASPVSAQEQIVVAAASDLQFVMPKLAQQFEKKSGVKVQITFGSSGNFFAQIKNGAPYDLFFSADMNYPRQLEAAELVEPGTFYEYARGKIVLWTKKEAGIDINQGLRVLLNAEVHKIAIANPDHAPYGRAALAALQKEDLYKKIADKLVLGENVSQAAQFIATGSAQVGIIPLSLALAPALAKQGAYAEIPPADYLPIEQGCAVLRSSKHKSAALQFLQFMKSRAALALLSQAGFSGPSK